MSIRALGSRVLARSLSALLQAITLVILTRILSPSEFAPFALIPGVGAASACLLGGGLGTLALRVGSERSWGVQLLRLALAISILIGLIAAAAGALLSTAGWLSIVAPSVVVAADQIVGVAQGVLAGQIRHREAARLLIVQRALPLGGLLVGGLIGGYQIVGYAVGGLFVISVVAAPLLRRIDAGPQFRTIFGRAMGFWAVSAVSTLAYLDVLIIGISMSEYAVGIYGAALRLAAPLAILTSSLMFVIVPEASALRRAEVSRFFLRWRRYGRWSALTLGLLAPVMCWLGILALGHDYGGSRWILLALIVGSAISLMSQITIAELLTIDCEGLVAKATALAYCVGVIALILLVGPGSVGLLWVYPLVLQGSTWVAVELQRSKILRSVSARVAMDESSSEPDDIR